MLCPEWGYSQLFCGVVSQEFPEALIRVTTSIEQANKILSEEKYELTITDIDGNQNDIQFKIPSKKIWRTVSFPFHNKTENPSLRIAQRPRSIKEIRQFIHNNQ